MRVMTRGLSRNRGRETDVRLAKAFDPTSTSGPEMMNSPPRATMMGAIIGTAADLAPEQARGKAVDRRADIWAFRVVVYEMLTGRRAFEGDDISTTVASVLKASGSTCQGLLRRTLAREPCDRHQPVKKLADRHR